VLPGPAAGAREIAKNKLTRFVVMEVEAVRADSLMSMSSLINAIFKGASMILAIWASANDLIDTVNCGALDGPVNNCVKQLCATYIMFSHH